MSLPSAPAGSYKYIDDEYLIDKNKGSIYGSQWFQEGRAGPEIPESPTFSISRTKGIRPEPQGQAERRRSAIMSEAGAQLSQSKDWRRPEAVRSSIAGKEGWQWCVTGRTVSENLAPPPDPDREAKILARTLSSPSTLTIEGQQESIRVLGSLVTDSAVVGRAPLRSSSQPRVVLTKKPPETCNQMYGSKFEEAKPADKYFGKNTCDVCAFTDLMFRTKTNYCPIIRF